MVSLLDLDMWAFRFGVPVQFLLAAPLFIAFVLTLVSIASGKRTENYISERYADANKATPLNGILILLGFVILVVIAFPKIKQLAGL
jgi:hypothetical protein